MTDELDEMIAVLKSENTTAANALLSAEPTRPPLNSPSEVLWVYIADFRKWSVRVVIMAKDILAAKKALKAKIDRAKAAANLPTPGGSTPSP